MYLNKTSISALIGTALLMSTASFAADIPIESRNLSDTTPPVSAAAGTLNWDLLQKNEQLENQLRILRGKIEELENTLEKLNSDLNNRYTDLDQRLELLRQKVDPEDTTPVDTAPENAPPTGTTNPNQSTQNFTSSTPPTPPNSTATATVPTTDIAPQIPATAANPAIAANAVPTPPSSVAQTNPTLTNVPTSPSINNDSKRPIVSENVESSSTTPSDQERAAYTVALEAYKNGGAKQAIGPMQNFLKSHPSSVYAGNAHFWLGEFNLASDPVNYNEAKKNYGIVIRQYQNSAKAPRALFQLYNISLDVDKNKIMAEKYKSQLLKYYPNAEEAKYFKQQK